MRNGRGKGVSDANAVLEELGKPGSLVFTDETGQVILTGDQVTSAQAVISQDPAGNAQYLVALAFSDEGSKAFAEATSANIGKRIAIVYDEMIYSNTRSINTSLTTFVMVLVLYILGVVSIREFALPLMVGIAFGTYSSVCLTGAM